MTKTIKFTDLDIDPATPVEIQIVHSLEEWQSVEKEIATLKARKSKLEAAIKSTLDYIGGEHSGPCDSLGICSNCSILIELDAVIEDSEAAND